MQWPAVVLPPAVAQGNAECWEGACTFERYCDNTRGRKPTGDVACWMPGWDFSTRCGVVGGVCHLKGVRPLFFHRRQRTQRLRSSMFYSCVSSCSLV